MRDLDVLCLGEALVDFLPERRGRLRDMDRFEVHSGGAPANVATGLARQGLSVAFAGVVGEDEFGHLLSRRLSDEGVACSLRFTDTAPTGLWFVALDAQGDRSFFNPIKAAGADKQIARSDIDDRLLERARVELDEQVHDDPRVVLVLVEAHVREELAHAMIAERGVGERVAGLWARAALDLVGVDGDRARGDPRRTRDHPFPAVLDRLDAAVVEAEMRLVVHAVEALHDGLLQLVDHFRALAGLGIDLVDPLVVDLDLQIL